VAALPATSGESLAEPRERQCAEQEAEVTPGDIVEARDQQQVPDDPQEPRCDQVAAEPGAHEDHQTRDDLDDADHDHEVRAERVRQHGTRRGRGKPAYTYELTPEADQFFPKAYDEILGQLVDVLADRLTPELLGLVLDDLSRRLSIGRVAPPGDLRSRVE
jgi:predicted ArsR family transcriptional regulator